MASHDHEVDGFAPCGVDDRLAGISLPDQEGHADPALAAVGDEQPSDELAVGTELVDAADRAARGVAIRRIDHAHDEQFRGEVTGEVQRLGRCPIGRRGQVRRQEDPAEGARAAADVDNGDDASAHDRDRRLDWHAPMVVRKPDGAK